VNPHSKQVQQYWVLEKEAVLWILGRDGESMLPKQLFFTSPQPLKSLHHQTQGSRVDTWVEGEREARSVSPGI